MRFSFYKLWLCVLLATIIGCGGGENTSNDDSANDNDNTVAAGDDSATNDAATDDSASGDDSSADDSDAADDSSGDDSSGDDTSAADAAPADDNDVASVPAPVENGFDTRYVSDEFFAALVIHPKRILESELVQSIPEGLRDEMLSEMEPFDPTTVEQIALFTVPVTPEDVMMLMTGFGSEPSFEDIPVEGAIPPDGDSPEERSEGPDSDDGSEPGSSPPDEPAGQAGTEADESTPNFDGLFTGLEEEPEVDPEEPKFDPNDGFEEEVRLDEELGEFEQPSFAKLFGFIVRFVDADAAAFLKEKIQEDAEQIEHAGQTIYLNPDDPETSAWMPDDRTFVVSGVERTKKVIDSKGSLKSPLISQLAATSVDNDLFALAMIAPVRETLTGMAVQATTDEDGNPAAGMPDVVGPLEKLSSVSIVGNVGAGNLLEIHLTSVDEAARDELKGAVDFGLSALKFGAGSLLEEMKDDPEAGALVEFGGKLLKGIAATTKDQSVVVSLARPDGIAEAIMSAIAQAEEAAKKAQRLNNLKMVGIALHNYYDTYRMLPSNLPMQEGKPASSWRVDLLPYLDQAFLADQYNFDEAWDSGVNDQALGAMMPMVFGDSDSKSTIVLLTGKNTAYPSDGPLSFNDITDGLSNTIFAVRISGKEAVTWTQPVDMVFDPEKPLACLGEIPEEGLDVVFFDGFARTLPKDIDADTFRKLVDPRDGEEVNLDD